MAKLLFFDNTHTYEVDGEKLPSVSQIIRFISREIYGEISQYHLDAGAERGTKVHKATELLDKYGEAEVDDSILPYLQAYMQFLQDEHPAWHHIEKSLYHPEKKYAGTIDRQGILRGASCLVDIKSDAVVKKKLVKAQLNGYADAWEANNFGQIEKLFCLHLKKDGKYQLYEVAKDMTEFSACLNLHNALEQKQPRGMIV